VQTASLIAVLGAAGLAVGLAWLRNPFWRRRPACRGTTTSAGSDTCRAIHVLVQGRAPHYAMAI